MIENQAIIKHF